MAEENTLVEIDSLIGNEFKVFIDDEEMLGVFRVDNFVTFRIDPMTGERSLVPFQLVKMVQRDGNNPFNKWLRETQDGSNPKRTIEIRAIDDGIETRHWTVSGARITEVRYEVFDTASSAMVEEIATVSYESISERWPITE